MTIGGDFNRYKISSYCFKAYFFQPSDPGSGAIQLMKTGMCKLRTSFDLMQSISAAGGSSGFSVKNSAEADAAVNEM